MLVAVKGLVNIPELGGCTRCRAWSSGSRWSRSRAFCCSAFSRACCSRRSSRCCCSSAGPPPRRWRSLGRIPGTRRYADRARNPDAQDVPGVLIVRVDAGLLYFNVGHVREEVRRLVADAGEGLRLVVWDLSTSPYVDIAGARMLSELERELADARRGAAPCRGACKRARSRPQGIRHGDRCVRCADCDRRRDRGARARSHAGESGSASVTWTAPPSRRGLHGPSRAREHGPHRRVLREHVGLERRDALPARHDREVTQEPARDSLAVIVLLDHEGHFRRSRPSKPRSAPSRSRISCVAGPDGHEQRDLALRDRTS